MTEHWQKMAGLHFVRIYATRRIDTSSLTINLQGGRQNTRSIYWPEAYKQSSVLHLSIWNRTDFGAEYLRCCQLRTQRFKHNASTWIFVQLETFFLVQEITWSSLALQKKGKQTSNRLIENPLLARNMRRHTKNTIFFCVFTSIYGSFECSIAAA